MVQQKAAEAAQQALEAEQAAEAQQQAEEAAPAAQIAATPVYVVPVALTSPMLFIFMHESGNDPGAINASSGACGLGQALPCSKMPCSLSDYNCQVDFFTGYANDRYGGWDGAYAFWVANSWW